MKVWTGRYVVAAWFELKVDKHGLCIRIGRRYLAVSW